MKLIIWNASDSEAIFGTIDAPIATDIKPIGHTQDASGFIGILTGEVIPTGCTVVTTVPVDTYYNTFNSFDGYWINDDLVKGIAETLRLAELDNLKVEYNGLMFSADEVSQGRLSRAALALADNETQPWWVNGSYTTISKADAVNIVRLAGIAQTALWAKYSM